MKHLGKIILGISVLVCLVAGLYCWINPIVERIEIHCDTLTMVVDDYHDINYNVYPTINEHDYYIKWESSDENIAKVSSGSLYAKGVGRAKITATVYGSKATASFVVVVNPKLVSNIELNVEYTTVEVGTSEQITSKVLPYNATDKTLVWISSNPDVISVEQDGMITARSQGTAIITATAVGGVFAQIEITAQDEIVAQSISLKKTSITLKKGNSETLEYDILPKNTTNTIVAWRSSNSDIVSVDENGKIVAKDLGSVTIYATTSNGKTAACYVTVPVVEPLRFDITIDFQKLLTAKVGDSFQIECSYYPSDVTFSVIWSSSNENIVSVTQTGIITINSSGSVVITATLGSKQDSIIITVA